MFDIHFGSHFRPFQIDTKLYFVGNFDKMAADAHFGCAKFTFDRISGHLLEIFDIMAAVGYFGCPKFTFD